MSGLFLILYPILCPTLTQNAILLSLRDDDEAVFLLEVSTYLQYTHAAA
jgi:hypothetical protein